MFGKLFGRGKPELDAFGVETRSTVVSVPTDENITTTVTTTPSPEMPAIASVGGLDLGGLLSTVRQAQQQAGGDHEAMAKLLRERLGGGAVMFGQADAATFDPSG